MNRLRSCEMYYHQNSLKRSLTAMLHSVNISHIALIVFALQQVTCCKALDSSPVKLLERLKAGSNVAVDKKHSFEQLSLLLRNCFNQLKCKSPLAADLIQALSVGADQGMPLDQFCQWQKEAGTGDHESLQEALIAARDLGLLLVEQNGHESGTEQTWLRLHTDLIQLLRADTKPQTVESLIIYLDDLLVKRKYGKGLDRSMHIHLFSLIERFGPDAVVLKKLYGTFWIHLWRTGELKQAFDLAEIFRTQAEVEGNKEDLQGSYGNQALVLQDWGKLDEAMKLLKKQEAICIEVGLKPSLKW